MAPDKRLVRATFRKQLSDGNYGTEAAEITFEWYIDDTDGSEEDESAAEEMLKAARTYVHGELARSPAQRVRDVLQPKANGADDDEGSF